MAERPGRESDEGKREREKGKIEGVSMVSFEDIARKKNTRKEMLTDQGASSTDEDRFVTLRLRRPALQVEGLREEGKRKAGEKRVQRKRLSVDREVDEEGKHSPGKR